MSPVPPPAGTFIPSDDWTDDPSFDLSPSARELALPSSPSSSSSSSRSRGSFARTHTSSPLRTTHLPSLAAKNTIQEDDEGFDDFDIPSPLPSFRSSSHAVASTGTVKNLAKTFMGQGPSGVGTITRLGSAPTKLSNNKNSVKARARALEKAWEADVDFDDFDGQLASNAPSVPAGFAKRLVISPPKANLPGPDALDDLDGFDFDEEDDQATLKAGATLKAKLPPPRKLHSQSQPQSQPQPVSAPEDDLESDLVLPLNLTNLSLVSQSEPKKSSRPRSSIASTAGTDWDGPATPSSARKSFGTWDESPRRTYETSVTSISDVPRTPKDAVHTLDVEEEDDMEAGLVLPSVSFFDPKRHHELNGILDKKRKPQYAPVAVINNPHIAEPPPDESIEDGLVLDNPRLELSRRQLDKSRRARTPNTPGVKRTVPPATAREKERAWERQREQGWGRSTPVLPSNLREKGQSTGLPSGLRSQSAGGHGMANDGSTRSSASGSLHDSPHRPRTSLNAIGMMPPPLSSTLAPATPSSSSRLRHQKSLHHLAPPQSPSLARKQSLASLQDALAGKSTPGTVGVSHGLGIGSGSSEINPPGRYHHSTSRLTMPTTASRAKARPPLSSVFTKTESGFSSASSVSTAASARENAPKLRSHKNTAPRVMAAPRRARMYGDGTELEGIEDLNVDDDPRTGVGLGKPSSRRGESFFCASLL